MQQVDEIVGQGKIAIVDFYAEWCSPCKSLKPILDKIVNENADVELVKIDIEKHMDLAQENQVRSVPTIMICSQKGKETLLGMMPENKIVEVIEKLR